MFFSIIAAVDSKMGIGKNGRLPWHLPSDLKFFHEKTIGHGKNAVVMGRLTWESIPEARRPLKDRLNIVITRNENYKLPTTVERASSLEKALEIADAKNKVAPFGRIDEIVSPRHASGLGLEEIFVIGGSQIFYDAIQHSACQKIYLTEVTGDFQCDAFFSKIDPKKFKKISASPFYEENGVQFRFLSYQSSDQSSD